MCADSGQQQGPRLCILEHLAVDRLSEAHQLGPNDVLGQSGRVLRHAVQVLLVGHGSSVMRQAVEHECDQLGHVQNGQLAQQVRVNCTDVLQKDDLKIK